MPTSLRRTCSIDWNDVFMSYRLEFSVACQHGYIYSKYNNTLELTNLKNTKYNIPCIHHFTPLLTLLILKKHKYNTLLLLSRIF